MLFKLHFGQETQTLEKDVSSLQELKDAIASEFKDTVPEDYHLEYKGNDDEKTVISSDRIYQDLVEEHKKSEGDFEVFIVATPKDSVKKKKERGPPIIIENASEFAEELKHGGTDHILELLEKGEAPSDKSLPSSLEDYAEKVHVLNEAVKEIKKNGGIDLKPEFIMDADSDLEPMPAKKVKPDSVVHAQIGGNGNGKENGKEIEETA